MKPRQIDIESYEIVATTFRNVPSFVRTYVIRETWVPVAEPSGEALENIHMAIQKLTGPPL